MIRNGEMMLFSQGVFRFSHQFQFFLDKVPVIDDLSALGADEMMMMVSFFFSPERVAALAVARRDLMDQAQSMQQFQGPVDRRQADPGI